MANSRFSSAGVAEEVVGGVLTTAIVAVVGAIGVGWLRVEEWWWAAPVMYALVTGASLYILLSGLFLQRGVSLSRWSSSVLLILLLSLFGILLYVDKRSQKQVVVSSQGWAGPYIYRNEMSIAETTRFTKELSDLFKQGPSLTFVITAPPSSEFFERDFRAFIVAACQLAENRCLIETAPDPAVDIDAGIPTPQYPGVVIHHIPVSLSDGIITNFMGAMGRFMVRKSSRMPEGIVRLNVNHNPHFYWFELGFGCPWKGGDLSECARGGQWSPGPSPVQ